MHFYWKILEELRFVGESWTIRDPSLLRSYRNWLRRNGPAIQELESRELPGTFPFPSPSVN